jgi:long-chain acyl-CoA synthetase
MVRIVTDNDLALQSLYRWERERPDRVFLTQPLAGGAVREWTWGQAAGEVRRMAAYLKAQGWEPGTRVAILSRNCAWWMMADLAIWMAGHVTVPIYPSMKAQSVRHMMEHSGAKACFLGATDCPQTVMDGIPGGVSCVRFPTAAVNDWPLWDILISANAPIAGSPVRPADDLATIIYTSGTTGTPKGVMHSFANLAYNARALAQLIGLTENERFISYLPLAHIVERAGLEGNVLLLGCRVFFSAGIETFLADLNRAQPTIFLSVPRLWLKFQQGVFARMPRERLDKLLRIPILRAVVKRKVLRGLGLGSVRNAASGAAPLPVEILTWYRKLGLNLAEGYGMTETLITHLPAPGSVRPGYLGRAIEGVEARLAAEAELQIRSPMNMLGYYRNPEATRAMLTEDGFIRTGDVARVDADGQLKIVGRLKEQFKTSKGKYVAPAPIESRFMANPMVEACCLMGTGMPHPFAVVLLSEEVRQRSADPKQKAEIESSLLELMESINQQLDPHEQVSFVAAVHGPWTIGNDAMTPTLKIRRGVLESRYQAFVDDWNRQSRPVVWESAVESRVAP